jgi:glycosyltransferase involved in cell wall biosynthesis
MSDLPVLSIARTDSRRPLVFSWGVSSYFGWGVYGLNLMLHLADHPEVAPCCAIPFGPAEVALDPLRERRLAALAQDSMPLWSALGQSGSDWAKVDHPLLEGLGIDLLPSTSAHGKSLIGSPSIGVVFLEQATLTPEGRQRADRFALIVAGSRWNEQVLRRQGVRTVTTVLQGVDTALYHPAARTGLFPGRFVIFSGGKLEYRKGQDLVLAAFRAFRQRHPEALLITAWHSPWTQFVAHAVGYPGIVPPPRGPDGIPDVVGWAVANGIPEDALIAIQQVPNLVMPQVVREADVALFPNRCEGGTNLVAMECLACGIPTIMSANTGHLDLLRHDIALPLERQGQPRSTVFDTTDWGESDVEEMVEKLEAVWRDRAAAAALGERAARFMAGMTWTAQLHLLLRAIDPFR